MAGLSAVLEECVRRYEQALALADMGDSHNPGPWQVARDVPLTDVAAWVDTVPGCWKVAYNAKSREILLYGNPSPPHGRTIGWFMVEFAEQIGDVLGRHVSHSFAYSSGETCRLQSFGHKTPDFAIIPDSGDCTTATVVGEVGYRCEANFQAL